jgi:hypothetical protein
MDIEPTSKKGFVMKNMYKFSMVMLALSALASCAPKTTNSTNALGTATSGSTANICTTTGTITTCTTTIPETGTGTTTTGGIACDGVFHDGATRCYYKNIPTIQVMGATTAATSAGAPYWSSATLTSSGTGISPNQFATDRTFNVRIIPRKASSTTAAVNQAVPGKPCSPYMNNSTKLYVKVRLRQQSASTGEIATLSSSIGTASNVWHFSPPVTAQPLVLEVMSVDADIRCNLSNKKLYCDYADIPLSNPTVSTVPTECVAFDLQYSTDETYDVPGTSAN